MNTGTFSDSPLEKSKLVQHVHEEGHRAGWDEARILKTGSNSICKKYKESTYMAKTQSASPV
jgi:hypothetical protein